MIDSYQPIYDAVRSRISNGDIGHAVESVALNAFDMSHMKACIADSFAIAAGEMARPSALYHPTLSADGTMWCALLGENLQVGVAGFGETPAKAMTDFDRAFAEERTPTAARLARTSA